MTPTDEALCVAVLVQRGLYRATLRHELAELGASVVDLGGEAAPSRDAQIPPVPVVVLVEHAPEWMSVEEGLARASSALPATPVALLVERASPKQVEGWLSAGYRGVLWKEAPASELELAIEAVRRGVPFVSVDVCPHLPVY